MSNYNIQNVIDSLPGTHYQPLTIPKYTNSEGVCTTPIMLQVESMRDHLSNEGHQLGLGLRHSGYKIIGHGCPDMDGTFVPNILKIVNPDLVVMQDQREWDADGRDFRDHNAKFSHVEVLAQASNIFKLTVLKDAHQRTNYHRESANSIGCHAWITYYHPRIVHHLAQYTRSQHLVRTFHSIDSEMISPYSSEDHDRLPAIISGAIGPAYPVRKRLIQDLKHVHHLQHPGYHRRGTASNEYVKTLSKFNVSIVTCSTYGYSLRKIIESTAAGCRVVTNLPIDDVLPEIDDNLIRFHPDESSEQIWDRVLQAHRSYNPEVQRDFSDRCKSYYDYRESGLRLAQDIETLRKGYCS